MSTLWCRSLLRTTKNPSRSFTLPFSTQTGSSTTASKLFGEVNLRRPSTYSHDRLRSRASKPKGPIPIHPVPLVLTDEFKSEIVTNNNNTPDDDDFDEDDYNTGGSDRLQTSLRSTLDADLRSSLSLQKTLGLDPNTLTNPIKSYLETTLRDRIRGAPTTAEETLRQMDYLTATPGSTEDLVGQRRALMELPPDERQVWLKEMNEMIDGEEERQLFSEGSELPELEREEGFKGREELLQESMEMGEIKPHHDWNDKVVHLDRVQKVQRGGTLLRYRALVIGGTTKGIAGFAMGKANDPQAAIERATRMTRQNLFFLKRYAGSGITSDLVGKHNSCRVYLRAVSPNRGIKGHHIVEDILTYFGITDCSAKTHGNRNPYNVVRATFKALMTHETLEDIALKRGKRLLHLQRARKLDLA